MPVTDEFLKLQEDYINGVFGEAPCDSCAKFLDENRCDVFPDGIPLAIVGGERDCSSFVPVDSL